MSTRTALQTDPASGASLLAQYYQRQEEGQVEDELYSKLLRVAKTKAEQVVKLLGGTGESKNQECALYRERVAEWVRDLSQFGVSQEEITEKFVNAQATAMLFAAHIVAQPAQTADMTELMSSAVGRTAAPGGRARGDLELMKREFGYMFSNGIIGNQSSTIVTHMHEATCKTIREQLSVNPSETTPFWKKYMCTIL
jgi:hypothetical protein